MTGCQIIVLDKNDWFCVSINSNVFNSFITVINKNYVYKLSAFVAGSGRHIKNFTVLQILAQF